MFVNSLESISIDATPCRLIAQGAGESSLRMKDAMSIKKKTNDA